MNSQPDSIDYDLHQERMQQAVRAMVARDWVVAIVLFGDVRRQPCDEHFRHVKQAEIVAALLPPVEAIWNAGKTSEDSGSTSHNGTASS